MTLSGETYSCSAGETFDSVANNVYGWERYAAELMCANPALCRKPVFTGGEVLQIPVVTLREWEVISDDAMDISEMEAVPANAPWKE